MGIPLHANANILYQKGSKVIEGPPIEDIDDVCTLEKYISIGYALDLYDDKIYEIDTVKKYKKEGGSGRISAGTIGELHTLGIWSRLTSISISSIPEKKKQRTPDFFAVANGVEVEIESTTATPKQLQIEKWDTARRLASRLLNVKKPLVDWLIYLDVGYDESVDNNCIEQYLVSSPVESILEIKGRYFLAIKPCAFPTGVLIVNGHEFTKPDWFSDNNEKINQYSVSSKIGGEQNFGQVRVAFQTPVIGYFNPVKNKLDEFQGSLTRAYYLTLNVSALPKALRYYNHKIQSILELDDRISGLVVYSQGFEGGKYGYRFKLFKNSKAKFNNFDTVLSGFEAGIEYQNAAEIYAE